MAKPAPKYDTTAVRLTEEDRQILEAVRRKMGVRSGSEVFRIALRALAREQSVDSNQPNKAA